jgi:ferredoxin
LPAALVGGLVNLAQNFSPIQNLAAHLNLSHFLSLAPSPAPVTGLWLLTLIPAALTSLLTKRQRLQNSLIPLLVWTLAAALLLAASHQPFDWSWGLIWLVLAFHLGREFWPSQNNLKGPLLVTLAGLAPLLAPWAFWPALALLSALEITLSLISLRRAKIMAQKDAPTEPPAPNLDLVAIRLCSRPQVSEMAIYQGPPGCRLAAALDSGPQECPEGCLSLGDCVAGCPHGAIKAAGPGLIPKLDKTRCRGCGACLPICPKGLLVLRPREASFVVTCRGSAKLKDMDSLCPVGCLKCGRCRKACPAGAIDRLGQLAPPQVSDQLCQKALPDCGLSCRSACPRSLPGPAMGLFSP